MQQKLMVTDLTSGSVTKLLFRFALPLFISNALQALYNLVDMVVVGQYIGIYGTSAVSVGGDILHLLTFIAMGFSSAGQVLIAQDVGRRDMDGVRRTIGTMFTLLLAVSLALTGICYLLRTNILDWLNVKTEYYNYTMDYTVTCILGLFFIYGYNIVSAILRGMGDSKRPFVFIAIAAILNTVLDIIFIKYMGLEVYGAALATVIGQGVSFIVSLVYLYMKKESFGFDFKLKSFALSRHELVRLTALGVPMAIQSAAVNFSKIVLSAWINLEGAMYTAMGGVYNKINMMSGVVSNSFTTAGSTMIGQNLGAGKTERVPKIMGTVLITGLIICTVVSVLFVAFSESIFRMFINEQDYLNIPNLAASLVILVAPTIVNFYGSATRSGAFSLINGSGNTKLNFAVAIIDGLISRIGIAWILGYGFKMACKGFWFGDALAGFMPIIIAGVYFLSGKWKTFGKRKA